MTEQLSFNPTNQENIAGAAAELSSRIENSLPRVPWLSNSGQQDAFRDIVQMVTNEANKLNADSDSKKAIVFWVLTLLYANKKSFRLATASVKNWGANSVSPVASSFVSWVGENIHPGQVVASSIESWH